MQSPERVTASSEGASAPRGDEARRLAIAYVALFFLAGVHLPYWPVWLASRGVDAQQLGVLLGIGNWARLTTPWIGAWADRTGRGPQLLVAVAIAVLVTLGLFELAHALPLLVVLSAMLGLAYAPIIPLLDGMSITAAAAGRMDYGRVRLWGSASFILASVVGGWLLQGRDAALVLTTLQSSAVILVLAVLWLRRLPSAPRSEPATRGGPRRSWAEILGQPRFATFLVCVGFLQGAHAVLYGFGTKHWQQAGISESTIGWFWGVGVIAEVALFAWGARIIAWVGAPGLLGLAGTGAIVRWAALGSTTAIGPTFAIQILHAASFAAMHLGAMSWIRDNIVPDAVNRATAVYTAIAGGVALGLGMPLGGVLFDRWQGDAYFAMAAFAAIGTAFAWRLGRPASAPSVR